MRNTHTHMHAAEPRKRVDGSWQARCRRCGWTSEPVATRTEASEWAAIHDIAENRD